MSRGLIVVDVQNAFCEGGSVPLSGGARIATKIADLWSGSAVSSTRTSRPPSPGGRVDAVFFKGAHSSSESGFEGADEQGMALADWLRARGVEHVDVVGIATDHFVRATALDAVKAGFRAHVRLDYSVGVAPDTINSTLNDFR
ncbi:isochorismatase family protein [Streptomyces anulatus]|uniref:isochorismatase family protein n=1 Tax=Streptomyces anulatus TaxID=1892 RepID=UPI003403A4CD